MFIRLIDPHRHLKWFNSTYSPESGFLVSGARVVVDVVAAKVAVCDVTLVAGTLKVVENRQVVWIQSLAVEDLTKVIKCFNLHIGQ